MTARSLSSPADAERAIAELFLFSANPSGDPVQLLLEVQEDGCFQDQRWVSVGEITVHLSSPNSPVSDSAGIDPRVAALRYGAFDWSIPLRDVLERDLLAALNLPQESTGSRSRSPRNPDVHDPIDAVADVAVRCGLASLRFDPMILSRMPFRTPVSVVVDTSAVIQGGLSFVARHLTPAARIRIPAIVHVEILDMADRFLSNRRKGKNPDKTLAGHALSQGGQRVLLRLELEGAVEIERARLDADPIRGAVKAQPADVQQGLSGVMRSFADRLILETAIRHRDRVRDDHPVMLMTSDQGLARMAQAEGFTPVFFDSTGRDQVFGSTVSGVNFAPFSSSEPRIQHTSLATLLWEFAVTFGSARLRSQESDAWFDVSAMGPDLKWYSYHAIEDLLWIRRYRPQQPGPAVSRRAADTSSHRRTRELPQRPRKERIPDGAYAFSPRKMLALMQALSEAGILADIAGMSAAGVKAPRAYEEYFSFLRSGRFALRKDEHLQKTPQLDELLEGLRRSAWPDVRELLLAVPALSRLLSQLRVGEPVTDAASVLRKSAFSPHCALLEAIRSALRIASEGVYATPNSPPSRDFARIAIDAYDAVRVGEEFALTGAWLERLVRAEGIHPMTVKERLKEAHQAGYLQRFFEGSTPETRYENRQFSAIALREGELVLQTVHLYHGDILMPGRASVSIKLRQGDHS